MKIIYFNINGIFGIILKFFIVVIWKEINNLIKNENNWIFFYFAGVVGVLGELVLDWGVEFVLEFGRGLCLFMVFKL